MTDIYKSNKQNYDEAVIANRLLSVKDIKIALRQRYAMHKWAVDAYETVLAEKIAELNRNRSNLA